MPFSQVILKVIDCNPFSSQVDIHKSTTNSLISKQFLTEPVGPRIASSLGDVTSFNQDQVNITIGQNLLTITDTKLLIHCEASGVPVPKIAWIRGNETLPSDGRMSAKNGILVVVEVETSDSGNYTCIAENTAATASVSSNVTVAGKEIISLACFTCL